MRPSQYIVPLNLSKMGFRYFRIMLESKLFSRKFIDYVVNHPNTGFVFQGSGWSGRKRVLGIGLWATNNAEISDIATNIRSVIPLSYKVVLQSELTRLEYFKEVAGVRRAMLLIDELDQKQDLTPLEFEYLKLLCVDGSLTVNEEASLLRITPDEVKQMEQDLLKNRVFYGCFPNEPLPSHYTKLFVDTTALSYEVVEDYCERLRHDSRCVYLARSNGQYNVEFEYLISDRDAFERVYKSFLKNSKRVEFDQNLYTNLFPQSKSLNTRMVQKKFVDLAIVNQERFDFCDSELWYINHEGLQSYLDIHNNQEYSQPMIQGEVDLFAETAVWLTKNATRFNLVDLGSGDGKKGRKLIESLGESLSKAYFPVDIQPLELAQAVRVHENVDYTVHPTVMSFKDLAVRFPLAGVEGEVNIYALLGGTYGNFDLNTINRWLQPLLGSVNDRLLINMPISDHLTREEIVRAYATLQVENMAFGVLKQIGFEKDDFVASDVHPGLKMQIVWEGDRLRTFFVLRRSRHLLGLSLDSGTRFSITSSWKPTLAEFTKAVAETFDIEQVFSNRSFAIAVCRRKG